MQKKTIEELEYLTLRELEDIVFDMALNDVYDPKYLRSIINLGVENISSIYRVFRGYREYNPVMLATWLGKKNALAMFLTIGVDLNARDNVNKTALHIAVDVHNNLYIDIVKMLIDAGAPLDAQDENGYTPWSLAGYVIIRDKIPQLNPYYQPKVEYTLRNFFKGLV